MTKDERKILESELYKLSPVAQEILKKFLELFNTDLPYEIWRDIRGYEGLYKVSNFGRVKSLHERIERILQCSFNQGYQRVTLCKDGERKTFSVHILVARTFIPNSDEKPQVNHIDGDKLNNHVDNLEGVTNGENQSHAWRI